MEISADDDYLDFLNTFPNMVEGVRGDHSIMQGEAVRFRCLMHAIHTRCVAARRAGATSSEKRDVAHRAIHDYYRKTTYRLDPANFEQDRQKFIASLKDARASMVSLTNTYFTEPFKLSLVMTSDVASEYDPLELFRLCALRGQDVLSRRTRFEARRQLTLGQLYFEMRRRGDSPDELDRDMSEFDDVLKENYFIKHKSAAYRFVAELDPTNLYRASHVTAEPHAGHGRVISTETRIELELELRFIRTRSGREIPVYYDDRIKRDAPFKLFAKNKRYVGSLFDLVGAKFVFLNEQDRLEGVDELRRRVVCVPGTVFGEASNIKRAGILDKSNGNSSSEFRATKYNVIMFDRIFELQFMLIQDWVNERCSRGPENHNLYKQGAYLSDLFGKIFPASLYHDWSDPEIRKMLVGLQLAKIWSSSP